jgi:hypothetical protein
MYPTTAAVTPAVTSTIATHFPFAPFLAPIMRAVYSSDPVFPLR